MLTCNSLKEKPKEFLSATGLTVEEFANLLPTFLEVYAAKYCADKTVEGTVRQRRVGGGTKGVLNLIEDKLLFILVYQKTYPLQTMVGLQFGLSQPQANEWIHRLMPVLQEALAQLGMTPLRDGRQLGKQTALQELEADYLIDGTERRRQRAQDKAQQAHHYSGKKKTHTDKNILLVHAQTQQVLYLSPTEPGSVHDKKVAESHPLTYPSGASLGKDSGFQGYEPPGVAPYQPKKSQKDAT